MPNLSKIGQSTEDILMIQQILREGGQISQQFSEVSRPLPLPCYKRYGLELGSGSAGIGSELDTLGYEMLGTKRLGYEMSGSR